MAGVVGGNVIFYWLRSSQLAEWDCGKRVGPCNATNSSAKVGQSL